jgi:diaminohydroxyphosphoribosylaminopyrimidine deaminase/5-amino-6-(5-phosphoribosylamino)uracil reductase
MNGRAEQDLAHLSRALELAARGLYTTDPNPRVGCLLVVGNATLGEGWHVRAGEPHAEIHALRAAGESAKGATAYVTLEPCSHTGRTPPCADALIAAGVARVVCCSADPNPLVAGSGVERLRRAGIEVTVGPLESEARRLNAGFFSRFERRRPFVRLKMAMSLDARTAPPDGGPVSISGEASRADVQTWRARSSAVLTGSGTVLCDDPRLDVRLKYGSWVRQPLRVVLDTERACPADARIFHDHGALVFAAHDAAHDAAQHAAGAGRAAAGQHRPVERVPRAAGGLNLHAVLRRLAELQVNELLVECGPRLAAGFVALGLVDEWLLYLAPHLLGADAAPLLRLDAAALPRGAAFEFRDVQRISEDLRLILAPTAVRDNP